VVLMNNETLRREMNKSRALWQRRKTAATNPDTHRYCRGVVDGLELALFIAETIGSADPAEQPAGERT
jgi:hypothetical protein